MSPTPIGFRTVGAASNRRVLVDCEKAFDAYASASPAAQCHLPAFLSVLAYPVDMEIHFVATGSTAGYTGPVGVPWISFDLDRPSIETAIRDAARLGNFLADRYGDDPLVMFSGSKGFHVSIPTADAIPAAPGNHLVARAVAETLASACGVAIDPSIYGPVSLFRAPNSRHLKTGLHKVKIDLDDLPRHTAESVRRHAAEPIPFDTPTLSPPPPRLLADWAEAVRRVRDLRADGRDRAREPRRPKVNPATLALLIDPAGVATGDRHRTIFSAAADLAEFGTVESLVKALLFEPGLDTGLPPAEVERQIECGLAHAKKQREGGPT